VEQRHSVATTVCISFEVIKSPLAGRRLYFFRFFGFAHFGGETEGNGRILILSAETTERKRIVDLSGRQQVNSLRLENLPGVSEAGLNVFRGQVVVFAKNMLCRPASTEQVHDEFDGNARALDDGLAHQHLRVHDNSLAPFHLLPHLFIIRIMRNVPPNALFLPRGLA
jgi:hypothetical protein